MKRLLICRGMEAHDGGAPAAAIRGCVLVGVDPGMAGTHGADGLSLLSRTAPVDQPHLAHPLLRGGVQIGLGRCAHFGGAEGVEIEAVLDGDV